MYPRLAGSKESLTAFQLLPARSDKSNNECNDKFDLDHGNVGNSRDPLQTVDDISILRLLVCGVGAVMTRKAKTSMVFSSVCTITCITAKNALFNSQLGTFVYVLICCLFDCWVGSPSNCEKEIDA